MYPYITPPFVKIDRLLCISLGSRCPCTDFSAIHFWNKPLPPPLIQIDPFWSIDPSKIWVHVLQSNRPTIVYVKATRIYAHAKSRELFSGFFWFLIIESTPLWIKKESANTPVNATKFELNLQKYVASKIVKINNKN